MAASSKDIPSQNHDVVAHNLRKKSRKSKVMPETSSQVRTKRETSTEVTLREGSITEPTEGATTDTRTPAQRKFDEIRRLRQEKDIEKTASMSHRQRIEAMNTHLSKLSEHNDMPKIGPG